MNWVLVQFNCHETRWRHDIETLSVLMGLCEATTRVHPGGTPHNSSIMWCFKISVVSLHKLSNKQPVCWWFETFVSAMILYCYYHYYYHYYYYYYYYYHYYYYHYHYYYHYYYYHYYYHIIIIIIIIIAIVIVIVIVVVVFVVGLIVIVITIVIAIVIVIVIVIVIIIIIFIIIIILEYCYGLVSVEIAHIFPGYFADISTILRLPWCKRSGPRISVIDQMTSL